MITIVERENLFEKLNKGPANRLNKIIENQVKKEINIQKSKSLLQIKKTSQSKERKSLQLKQNEILKYPSKHQENNKKSVIDQLVVKSRMKKEFKKSNRDKFL